MPPNQSGSVEALPSLNFSDIVTVFCIIAIQRIDMLTVGFLLYPQLVLSSITLPAEMLRAADQRARAQRLRGERLEIRMANLNGKTIAAGVGVQLRPTHSFMQLLDVDLLYLPAIWRNPLPIVSSQHNVLPLLRQLAGAGRLLCAVGTGSYLLAEADLLDAKPATTHWFFSAKFLRRYPAVQVKPRHLITRAGNLYCAGSINAVADLTGYFIEQFYNADIARQVEAQFSPEIRRPFRDTGFFDGELNLHHDEAIADAEHWLQQHLSQPIDFAGLARRLKMSQRSFNRRFKQALGARPGEYLQQLRLQQARELLRDSNLSIAEVGYRVGYPDAAHFSTRFRRTMAQSPSDYRRSVRGKLFRPG